MTISPSPPYPPCRSSIPFLPPSSHSSLPFPNSSPALSPSFLPPSTLLSPSPRLAPPSSPSLSPSFTLFIYVPLLCSSPVLSSLPFSPLLSTGKQTRT